MREPVSSFLDKRVSAQDAPVDTVSGSMPVAVAVLGFERAQTLDVIGPLEVFSAADAVIGAEQLAEGLTPDGIDVASSRRYQVSLYSVDGLPFTTSSGVTMTPVGGLHDLKQRDTLIIAGGDGVDAFVDDSALVAWLQQQHAFFRRLASVCTGAFILAQAGLLDHKRATTHWVACEWLQQLYPAIQLDREAIYTRDGNLLTSAGVSTGIDMALSMVAEDYGHGVAMAVAKWLVLYLHRSGGQRQFSEALLAQSRQSDVFVELLQWVAENLSESISVEQMAARVCMSPRHFSRRFQSEMGQTPMRYVASLRLEQARTLLENSLMPIKRIAFLCGFGSEDTFRRQFQRHYALTPQDYQRACRQPGGVP